MNFDFVNLLAHVVLICTLATILFSVAAYIASRRKTLRRRPAVKPPHPAPAPPPKRATVTRVHRPAPPGSEANP
ncbi:MAG: hypothetical protein KA788_10750 [Lacunisphaera sp.]|nr:hypothetical protein [Lacunisphaera sp.]